MTRRLARKALPSDGDLLEPLADSRVAVLHLARKAREDKQTALAKQLTEQGQVLKLEIARLRAARHDDWGARAGALAAQAHKARARLTRLIAREESSAKKWSAVSKTLTALSHVVALSRKAAAR